jgi:hypothetical protein
MFFGKPYGKEARGRLRSRREDNIDATLNEIKWKDLDDVRLVQDREHRQTLSKKIGRN